MRSALMMIATSSVAALSTVGVADAQMPPRPFLNGVGASPISQQAQTSKPDSHTAGLAFDQADISDVASEVLGTELHIPYVIDPAVTGKMSLRLEGVRSRSQILAAFEAALALTDVVLVPHGDQLLLVPRAKARGAADMSASPYAAALGYRIISAPVGDATASDVAKTLEALGPPGLVIHADDAKGVIVLGGTPSELQRALRTIRLMGGAHEADTFTRVFQLKAASATTVASDLDHIMKGSGVTGVSFTPIPRIGALLVSARSARTLDDVGVWLERLDQPSHEEKTALWLYHPQNVSVDDLDAALGQLFGLQQKSGGRSDVSASASAPAFNAFADRNPAGALGGAGPSDAVPSSQTEPVAGAGASPQPGAIGSDIKIGVEKQTNTLIVMAPESRWLALQHILDQLDRAPDQILIEATVLEVTLNQNFQFGVNFNVLGSSGRLGVASTQGSSVASTTQQAGLTVSYLGSTVQAAINTLAAVTKVRVVSAPKLLTVDNRSATLEVGDQVPIVNQTAQSTVTSGAPIVQSTEYKDTGIILKIQPRINGPDSVYVDFSQEVSSVQNNTSSSIDSPIIQERKFQSSMTLHEGQTVALGGLISSNKNDSISGIPGLQDIPGIGPLFRTTTKTNDRTEIIVLLTAKIIRTSAEAAKSTSDLKAEMGGIYEDDHSKKK